MQRETKEITLPKSGDKVVVNTYITGGENLGLTRFYLKTAEELDQNSVKEKGRSATIFEETQKLAFKYLVVSINGKKDGEKDDTGHRFSTIEFIYSLRKADYQFLVNEVNKITKDEDFETEKKTPSSTN